jgi:hypothetical protein
MNDQTPNEDASRKSAPFLFGSPQLHLAAKAGSPRFKRGLDRRRFGKETMKKTRPVLLGLLLLPAQAAVKAQFDCAANSGATGESFK